MVKTIDVYTDLAVEEHNFLIINNGWIPLSLPVEPRFVTCSL